MESHRSSHHLMTTMQVFTQVHNAYEKLAFAKYGSVLLREPINATVLIEYAHTQTLK